MLYLVFSFGVTNLTLKIYSCKYLIVFFVNMTLLRFCAIRMPPDKFEFGFDCGHVFAPINIMDKDSFCIAYGTKGQ